MGHCTSFSLLFSSAQELKTFTAHCVLLAVFLGTSNRDSATNSSELGTVPNLLIFAWANCRLRRQQVVFHLRKLIQEVARVFLALLLIDCSRRTRRRLVVARRRVVCRGRLAICFVGCVGHARKRLVGVAGQRIVQFRKRLVHVLLYFCHFQGGVGVITPPQGLPNGVYLRWRDGVKVWTVCHPQSEEMRALNVRNKQMKRRKQATENTQTSVEKRARKAEETFYKRKRSGRKRRALKEWARVRRPRTLIEGSNLAANFGENTNRRFEANN